MQFKPSRVILTEDSSAKWTQTAGAYTAVSAKKET